MNTTYEGSNRLMFITNRTDQYTEQQETQWVLEGGCRWIQLRMKDNPSLETARELVKLCAPYQARLCIDDDVQMALESGATAVHLGKNDMPVDQACELVHQSGKTDFLIGATANTFEDICHAARLGASYIGLGPFRFTQTKKKLSPILGLDGYKRILEQCREAGITLPVYAIGGIEIEWASRRGRRWRADPPEGAQGGIIHYSSSPLKSPAFSDMKTDIGIEFTII